MTAITDETAMVAYWLDQWADWMRRDGHVLHRIGWPRQTIEATMVRSNHAVAEDDQHAIDLIRHADQMRRVDACIEDLRHQQITLAWAVYQWHGLGSNGAKFGEDALRELWAEALETLIPILDKRGFA